MRNRILLFAMSMLCLTGALSWSQTPSPAPQNSRVPCWRQAGISQATMEQYRSIEGDAHAQVAAVCENTSLTPRQKQMQIREIRRQAKEKMDALMTPEQQGALHSCQQQRAGTRPQNENYRNGVGPCGNLAGRQRPENGKAPGSNPQPPAEGSTPQN